MPARHIVVHGRVQGVGFRYFVQTAAGRRALVGSVRNRSDGCVEIVVEGDDATLDAFLDDVRRGPALSRVDRLDVNPLPESRKFHRFDIEGW